MAWFLFLVWLNKIKTRIYNGQFETLFHIETNVVTWMCRPFHVLFPQISIIVFWKSRHICILFEVLLSSECFVRKVTEGQKVLPFRHLCIYMYSSAWDGCLSQGPSSLILISRIIKLLYYVYLLYGEKKKTNPTQKSRMWFIG